MTQKKLAKAGTGNTTPLDDKKPQTIKVDYRPIRKTENEEYLKNANVKAFLGAIAWSEGGGYDFKFGAVKGKAHDKWRFTNFSTHPGVGSDGHTTAAGMYQIKKDVWQFHGVKGMGLTDFGPETQDLIAVSLLKESGAMPPLFQDNFKEAMRKASHRWAALEQGPGLGNFYPPQPYKKYEETRAKYLELGGKDGK